MTLAIISVFVTWYIFDENLQDINNYTLYARPSYGHVLEMAFSIDVHKLR